MRHKYYRDDEKKTHKSQCFVLQIENKETINLEFIYEEAAVLESCELSSCQSSLELSDDSFDIAAQNILIETRFV